MVKGIIFDLDGTLVDSLSVTFDAFNYSFAQCGGKKLTPAEIMAYFGTGEGEIFARILGREHAETAYNACKTYLDSHIADVPLHKGVGDLLELIKSEGVPISIFTGRSWDTTEMILKHHRILDRFVRVVANDHVNLPKPSPEGLHLALSHMNLKPSEVLFIGDSAVDIMAARSAGSRGVAALWDLLADKEQIKPHQPHHWVNHPQEIWEVWKELKVSE